MKNYGEIQDNKDVITKEYLADYGGTITVIKVNNTIQPITEKTVNIAVPTQVSQLTNDSNYAIAANVTAEINAMGNTKSNVGHTHSMSDITEGTLGGRVRVNASAASTVANPQIRDIYAGTVDLNPNTDTLASGVIYCYYK